MASVETQPIVLPSSSFALVARLRVAALNTNAAGAARSGFQKRIGTALRFVTFRSNELGLWTTDHECEGVDG